jgi:hypothetical protein
VGFFTAAQTAVFDRRKPRFLHVAPHKFSERNIEPPTWAQSTVFLVALRPNPSSKSVRDFKEAVLQVAATYTMWNPWAEPVAPWNPSWPQGTAEAFVVWHDRAKDVVSKPSLEKRIASHLCPIFPPTTVHEHSTLVVIGCAAFNRPHTDVVGTLVAEKMQFVVEELRRLVSAGEFTHVEIIIPDGRIISNHIGRMHLHPFIFLPVSKTEELLGMRHTELTRLWGRVHARSDIEIAEAFDESAKAMQRQLIEPLAKLVSVPVYGVSWFSLIEPYLQEAITLVEKHAQLLEAIYLERVRTRPSYATLHAIDPQAGLRRTFGNAVLYIAEAMHLRDHPDCVVANCEVHDTYWKGLAPIVLPLWGKRVPYIGMVGEKFRQPWGY